MLASEWTNRLRRLKESLSTTPVISVAGLRMWAKEAIDDGRIALATDLLHASCAKGPAAALDALAAAFNFFEV